MDTLMSKCACGMCDGTLLNVISVKPPGDYRTCGQLVDAIQSSIKRQNQLLELERKAGSGVGSLIAGTTYRPQYLKEHANEMNMRRSAREKACTLPAKLPPLDYR